MKIKLNPLNTQSIQDAIDHIEKKRTGVKGVSKEVMQRLIDLGVAKAKELCPLDTGATIESIRGYVDEDGKGVIVAGGNAAWIEFGTGVKGADSPYPGESSVMAGATPYNGYMSGSQIYETKDGRIGWNYYNENRKKWEFTEGMPSRPFMWETAHYLRAIAPQEIKIVLGHKG
jgi:hypothetical protein